MEVAMEMWFSEFHTPDVKLSIRMNKQLYSVESDVLWNNKLKNYINAFFITVDLKAKKLGYPGNNTTIED